MDLNTYIWFIGAVVILVIVPGPDMAYMLARTIAQGRSAGVLAAVGINAGAYVHVLASVVGLTAILAASSVAFTTLKWLGVGYLMWIGIQALISKSGPLDIETEPSKHFQRRAIFWQGFWSDVLNPKVGIFFLAFLPQFIDVHSPNMGITQQLLLLGITCNVVAIFINVILVCFASSLTSRLRESKRVTAWLNKAMGAIFITLGVRLASERL